jgi:basic membrane protein A
VDDGSWKATMMRKLLVVLAACSALLTMVGIAPADAGHGIEGTVCLVADQGGFDDGGFAAGALAGLERAGSKLHVDIRAEAAQSEEGLPDVIGSLVQSGGCDLIIGVGFVVGLALEPFVVSHPDQRFAVVDFSYGGRYENVSELLFRVDEAAFLAGYIAAGISDTGKVGVYGGANIVPVTLFMDGYSLGVEYYNQQSGRNVRVLGWNPETRSGRLLDSEFQNPELGRTVTLDLFDQGADTVFAVAGRTGEGSLQAAAERKAAGYDVRVIQPDFDWYNEFGDPARILLTSVVKDTNAAVFNTIEALVDGNWRPGMIWEDLESDGVDIAPFHKTNNQVPGLLKNDLKAITAGIVDGTIPTVPAFGGTACLVTGLGGIDDRSFNQTAWQGALDAAAQFGISVRFLESASAADHAPNIDAFVDADCGVIITIGFLIADATAEAAKAHPDQDFAIIDFPVADFPGTPWCLEELLPDGTCGGDLVSNVRGSTFHTDESSFLAGYLAAGMTRTGAVGTYGGLDIPSVTTFMDGFVWGVDHYNSVKGAGVDALGWDPDTRTGLFTGSFSDIMLGVTFAQDLVDQGADVLMPVAGPVGLGSASFCQDSGRCAVIGVDSDAFFAAPEFGEVWLTSVVKAVDIFVLETIENEILFGTPGPDYVGTLANGGTDLAPYHEFDDDVPQALEDEVDQLRLDIIGGVLVPGM